MQSRRPLSVLPAAALLVVLLAPCRPAQARPVRTLYLDQDVPRAEVVVVAKVLSSVFKKNAHWMERRGKTVMPVPANAGFAVDEHEVTAKVLLNVKGAFKAGTRVRFRHRHASTTGQPMLNGFMSHAFKLGDNYLLVLVKEPDGVLAVAAPEQWFYPTFPDTLVPKLPASQHAASALVHVYRLLLARFEDGKTPDSVGARSLQFLTGNPAGRAYLKVGAQDAKIVKRLTPMADALLGTDDQFLILHVLRDLRAPIGAKQTLKWILNAALRPEFRVNLLSNLNAAPPKEHLAAIDKIIGSGTDPAIVTAATRARRYAVKRVERAEASAKRKKEREERRRRRREAGGK